MIISPLIRQYAVVIIANLNVLSTGVGLSWTSPVLVKLSNATLSPLGRAITADEASWIVSVSGFTGIPGALVAGVIANRLGRKYTILASSLPKVASWLLICLAHDVRMIYAARLLQGLADSLSFSVVSMYASEVASKEVRGSLGTMLQVMCTLGIVLTLCVGPFLPYLQLGVFGAVLALCCAVPAVLLPESPYHSYSKGKKEEALKTLTKLRGSSIQAAEGMKEFEANDARERTKLSELIRLKPVLKGLIIVIILAFGTQATGFNAVTFSLQSVLESTKTDVPASLASVVIGIAQLLACLVTAFITDRFGRKPIVFTTLIGMCIGLTSLGVFFKLLQMEYPIEGGLQFLPLASMLLVVCAFSGGLGSLLWPLMSELFSDEARALGVTVGMTSLSVCSFLTTRFFNALLAAIGAPLTYWLFALDSLLLAAFVLFVIPETKGRSFAEIQSALGGKVWDKSDGS